jgi:hypothetical protein
MFTDSTPPCVSVLFIAVSVREFWPACPYSSIDRLPSKYHGRRRLLRIDPKQQVFWLVDLCVSELVRSTAGVVPQTEEVQKPGEGPLEGGPRACAGPRCPPRVPPRLSTHCEGRPIRAHQPGVLSLLSQGRPQTPARAHLDVPALRHGPRPGPQRRQERQTGRRTGGDSPSSAGKNGTRSDATRRRRKPRNSHPAAQHPLRKAGISLLQRGSKSTSRADPGQPVSRTCGRLVRVDAAHCGSAVPTRL